MLAARRRSFAGWLGVTVLLLGALAPSLAQPAAPDVLVPLDGIATLPAPGFPRHQVIDADKLEVTVGTDLVTLRGKQLGQTTLFLWDRQQKPLRYLVKVVPAGDLDAERQRDLQAALAADTLLTGAAIAVRLQDGVATLSGSAPTAAAVDRAVALAAARAQRVDNQLVVQAAGVPGVDGPPAPPAMNGEAVSPLPQPVVRIEEPGRGPRLELSIGEARRITVPTQLDRVLIADPDIADVVLIPPREVVVTGKAAGGTTLMLWYRGTDQFLREVDNATFEVGVIGAPQDAEKTPGNMPAPDEIRRVLQLLSIEGVEVVTRYDAANPSVLLIGDVPSQGDRLRVEQAVAALFPLNTRIANFTAVRRADAMSQEELDQRAAGLEKLLAEHLPNAAVTVRLRADGERLRVLLSGQAPLPVERLRAEELVQFELGDSATITNDVQVPLPPLPDELAGAQRPTVPLPEALAEALLTSGVRTDLVRLSVNDERRVIEISGSVRSEEDQELVLEALNSAVEPYGVYELRERNLHVRVPRVVTEVQIVEMSASDQQRLGVVWGAPITQAGGGAGTAQGSTQVSNTNGALSVWGQLAAGNPFSFLDPIAASIRALVDENRARILSQPNISSDNGEEGVWEVVTEVPLPSTTTIGTTGAQQSVEFRPVGIRLLVTPEVQWADPSNRILMSIETEVSAIDPGGLAININGALIPAFTTRRAQTIVTVDDNQTLVIGGLTTEEERRAVSRVPFLSDIPLIGNLFRYTDNRKIQTTVVVVMTPRIQM